MSPAERVERLRLAFRANPRDPGVATDLGIALGDSGLREPAARAFAHALSLDPNRVAAHCGLGALRLSEGDGAGAVNAFSRAARLEPSDQGAFDGLAAGFELLGFNRLAAWTRKAREGRDRPIPHALLKERGQALLLAGALDEAEADLLAFRAAQPRDADGALLLGQLRARQDDLSAGAALCREATQLRPDAAEPWAALGDTLAQMGTLDQAEAALRQAIALRPDFPDPRQNLANVLNELGRHDEALSLLQGLVAQTPDEPAPHSNLSNLLLLTGRFKEGWTEYEWRRRMPQGAPSPVGLPDWQGEPLRGRGLHLIGEQGMGDALMFASCLQDLEALDGPVTLHIEPRLARLMARSFPWLRVTARLPEGDDGGVALPIGSLPRLLRPDEASFARNRPFLLADATATQAWKSRFAELGAGLTVGISWRGGKDRVNRRQRTTLLEDWLPLLRLPGVTTIDLQYGDHEDELRGLAARSSVAPHRFPELDPVADFDGFVAQVAALDLVVSVCNTTIHVAGGLGVPTLLITPSAPSWRWLTERTDCLWYPSVSLIRQARGEPWEAVLTRAASAVAERAAERAMRPERQDLPGNKPPHTAEIAALAINPATKSAASSTRHDTNDSVTAFPGIKLAP